MLPKTLIQEVAFLVSSYRRISALDELVISGGGQLTEKDGPWAFPYTIFKWVLLGKAARVRCIVLNVGAGPLSHPLSRFFTARSLHVADYVSFRDRQSQTLARAIGFGGKSDFFPDIAHSFDLPESANSLPRKRDVPTVGIGPMDHFRYDQDAYDQFIAKFAVFSSWVAAHSYSPVLFGGDMGVDPAVIQDLQEVLRRQRNVVIPECATVNSVPQLLSAISSMDYIITCRFHGVVFAHLLNKPVIAISPHPKVTNLMADLGLADYCLDIKSFDGNLLAETFMSLVRNSAEIKDRMSATLASYQSRLATQFDDLFPIDAAAGRAA